MPWITDNILLAGAGISENNWNELCALGITAVINLRNEHQDKFSTPFPVAYLWLPTEDHTDPTPQQLIMGAQIINFLVKNNHRILVHCKMGIHRSATMVVAYLIYSGLSKEDAIWKFREKGSRLYGSDEQQKTLDQFIALLSK